MTPSVEGLGPAASAAGPFLLSQFVGTRNPTRSIFTIAIRVALGHVFNMKWSESPEPPKTDPLLGEILAALSASGVSRTQFGYTVAGDPTLIPKMERGRHIKKPDLRSAIEAEIVFIRGNVTADALRSADRAR